MTVMLNNHTETQNDHNEIPHVLEKMQNNHKDVKMSGMSLERL